MGRGCRTSPDGGGGGKVSTVTARIIGAPITKQQGGDQRCHDQVSCKYTAETIRCLQPAEQCVPSTSNTGNTT